MSRNLIRGVIKILGYLHLKYNFSFMDQSTGWTLQNGSFDFSLFLTDSLHLTEEGNVKIAK